MPLVPQLDNRVAVTDVDAPTGSFIFEATSVGRAKMHASKLQHPERRMATVSCRSAKVALAFQDGNLCDARLAQRDRGSYARRAAANDYDIGLAHLWYSRSIAKGMSRLPLVISASLALQ